MNAYLDDALVGVLLLLSAGYVFSTLGPRKLRRRVLAAGSAWLARAPARLGLHRAAQRMARAAQTKPQGACGGCDNCGSESPSTQMPQTGTATEIKVPIASIRRAQR